MSIRPPDDHAPRGGVCALRIAEVAAAALVAVLSLWLVAGISALFAAALGVLAILVAVSDLQSFTIPDAASLAIGLLGVGLAYVEAPAGSGLDAIQDVLLRSAVVGLLVWLLRAGYRMITGVDGIGMGDVKLSAAGAPWVQWVSLPIVLEIAALSALIVVSLHAITRRQWPDRGLAVPFGAFLAPAFWIGFMVERTLGLVP
jgi:leader peptidase (prepilin peptidase)/N-methyltransferase